MYIFSVINMEFLLNSFSTYLDSELVGCDDDLLFMFRELLLSSALASPYNFYSIEIN